MLLIVPCECVFQWFVFIRPHGNIEMEKISLTDHKQLEISDER